MKYRTTAAYVSGAICGHTWMPDAMAGTPGNWNLRAQFDRFNDNGASMRDALLHILMEHGGDFRAACFTADTVIRVERRAVEAPGKYRVHVRERQISSLLELSDLADSEVYTCDVMGDES